MDYTKFFIAIRRYAKGRIGRADFMDCWSDAQRIQGIEAAKPKQTAAASKTRR